MLKGAKPGFGLGAALLLGMAAGAQAQQKTEAPGGAATARNFVVQGRHAESIPLRDMPTTLEAPPMPRALHRPLPGPRLRRAAGTSAGADRAAQRVPGPSPKAAGPQVLVNFIGEGISDLALGGDPSDSEGNIGATQYVEWINTSVAVFNKDTGVLISGPTPGNMLFQTLGGDCFNTNDGDPIVQYDKAAQRWVLSQFSVANNQGPNPAHPASECIAVSARSDATGSYHLYQFTYTDFNDYPKMGVWTDKYLENYNMFQPPTTPGGMPGNFVGDEMCAFDRSNMLAGNAANQACTMNVNEFSLLPSDLDGSTPPPAGEKGFFLDLATSNSLNLFTVTAVDFTSGVLTVSGPTSITVAPFTLPCGLAGSGSGVCIPQNDGGAQPVDSLGDRLMHRLAYRNFGNHEVLMASHTVDVTGTGMGQTGVRWYEIRSPGSTPTVFQTGTYAPDANFRWMPSVAMDKVGDIAAGYSVSSSSMNPSIFISARTPSDPLGTLSNETLIQSGSFATGDTRWGDYSAMTVDPVDDCTLWYVNQYLGVAPGGADDWDTKIANFQMPGCMFPAVKLGVAAANSSPAAGASFGLMVTAVDANGQRAPSYAGTVHFTSTDAQATLPPDYTFVPTTDAGAHTFNVSMGTVGSQTITATDTVTATLTGTSGALMVTPGPVQHFGVVAPGGNPTAGAGFTVTVTAQDAFNNTVPTYAGTVQITSSDPKAALPAPSTLTNGVGMFSLTLKTAGRESIMAADTMNKALTGTLVLPVNPAGIASFVVSPPPTATTGGAFNITVKARDQFGNLATNYTGTAHFTSSGVAVTLPGDHTYTSGAGGDNGVHVFTATAGGTPGSLTLTVNDTVATTATGTATLTLTTDAMLRPTGRTIRLFRNPQALIVATFTDDDTSETGSKLTVTIDWGDGTPVTAPTQLKHVGGSPNLFQVFGNHVYAGKGPFTVKVTINDSGGSQAIAFSTASFFPRNLSF